ncbi:MAG: hypothetical protein ACW98I_20250, partial [Candidatus Hodarchaeales archaeon]
MEGKKVVEKHKVGMITVLAILMISATVSILNGEINQNNEKNLTRQPTEKFETSMRTSQAESANIRDNTTWTDYVVDDDQNGFYDRLVVDLGTVNLSDQDIIIYGVLKTSTGSMIGVAANGSIYSPMFNDTLTLSFSGPSIYSSGIDGPYNLWIDFLDPTSGMPPTLNFTMMYTTSQAYDHTTFDSPGATMIGFADSGRDTDSDSLINEIVISVTVSVIESGSYSIMIMLGVTDIFSQESQRFSGNWDGFLDPGITTVEVPIDTSGFYREKLNGPYNLSLALLASYSEYTMGYQQMIEGTFQTTTAYQYMNFDPIPVYLTGNYWDQGIDTDFNGKFDQLEFLVEINVTEAAEYHVELYIISTAVGNFSSWNGWGEFSGNFNLGLHNVSITIDATTMYSQKMNTSFLISSGSISDNNYNTLDQVYSPYTTRYYNYDEFDMPGALLTGNYWDQGIDTDFNGKFDQLEFLVEINVTEAADYRIELQVTPSETGNYSSWYGWGEFSGNFNLGLHNVSITTDTTSMYSRKMNTSFLISYVSLSDNNYNTLDQVYSPYTTRFYNYDEFDMPGALLTGNYWDQGIDT